MRFTSSEKCHLMQGKTWLNNTNNTNLPIISFTDTSPPLLSQQAQASLPHCATPYLLSFWSALATAPAETSAQAKEAFIIA